MNGREKVVVCFRRFSLREFFNVASEYLTCVSKDYKVHLEVSARPHNEHFSTVFPHSLINISFPTFMAYSENTGFTNYPHSPKNSRMYLS